MSLVPAPVASAPIVPPIQESKADAYINLFGPFVTDKSTFANFNLTDEDFLKIAQNPDLARPKEDEYNEFHATKVGNIETYTYGTDLMTKLLSDEKVTCNNKTFRDNLLFAKEVHMDLSKIKVEKKLTGNKLAVKTAGGRGNKHPVPQLRTRKLRTLATAVSHAIFGSEIKLESLEKALQVPDLKDDAKAKAYPLAIFLLLAHNPDGFSLTELVRAKIWTFKVLVELVTKEKYYTSAAFDNAVRKSKLATSQKFIQGAADAHQYALFKVYKTLFPSNRNREQQWGKDTNYMLA